MYLRWMAAGWAAAAAPVAAAAPITVTVVVADPSTPASAYACSAWSAAAGFPIDGFVAAGRSVRGEAGWTCALTLPGPGTYALAVMDDANGNGAVDRNRLGAPIEGWGTSNDVTHLLRPPSFDESAVALADGARIRITVHR